MIHRLTVVGVENDQAILKDSSGEVVVWPKSKLPENIAPGAELYFNIESTKNLAEDQPQLAKNILNEILKIS